MIQQKRKKPIPILTCAHQGVIKGEPVQVICVQSKVSKLIPKPVDTPNNWLTVEFVGAIQQTHEKYDNAVKKNPNSRSALSLLKTSNTTQSI